MGAVAQAMLERLEDQVALDLGDGAADQVLGDLLGGTEWIWMSDRIPMTKVGYEKLKAAIKPWGTR